MGSWEFPCPVSRLASSTQEPGIRKTFTFTAALQGGTPGLSNLTRGVNVSQECQQERMNECWWGCKHRWAKVRSI